MLSKVERLKRKQQRINLTINIVAILGIFAFINGIAVFINTPILPEHNSNEIITISLLFIKVICVLFSGLILIAVPIGLIFYIWDKIDRWFEGY